MNTLSLNGVNKHYGAKHALIDFDYEFTDDVYGLLGPNGAGKSTLMNVITQNIPADPDGEILWNGEDIAKLQAKYRRRIGFMPQQQELYPSFTASRFQSISLSESAGIFCVMTFIIVDLPAPFGPRRP